MTHTPGPWTVSDIGNEVLHGSDVICGCYHRLGTPEFPRNQLAGNMAIIAKSPIMSDALKQIVSLCGDTTQSPNEIIGKIYSIAKKAK